MRMLSFALSLLIATPVGATPVRRVELLSDHGPMAPKYLSVCEELMGQPLTQETISKVRHRLAEFKTVSAATFDQRGDTALLRIEEVPEFDLGVYPLPFALTLSAEVGLREWRFAGLYHSPSLYAGYEWREFDIYDPRLTNPPVIRLKNEYPDVMARWGVLVAPFSKLFLVADANWLSMQGDLSSLYELAQTTGLVSTVGPELRIDTTDSEDFPRRGSRVGGSIAFGLRPLGNQADYTLYTGTAQQYFPVGDSQAAVLAVHGGYGSGTVPWMKRYGVGGPMLLRAHPWNRFLGNRMLVGTAEYRSRIGTLDLLGTTVGFTGGAFGVMGRSWDENFGAPFPQDLRPGAGLWLGIGTARSTLIRLEAGYGSEGAVVNAGVGLPVPWRLW